MARIAGINIPPHQHAEIGLTAIFGIGRARARKICEATGIPYSKKVKDLTDNDLERIRDQIGQFTIEGDLRRETTMLPRFPPSPRAADARPTHAHQCPHPQGSAQGRPGTEEIIAKENRHGKSSSQ
jgi:predicted ribosome quality control (RQC) complex YloA/Tae2 family protein